MGEVVDPVVRVEDPVLRAEDPVVRTPDHAKLLDYGLDQKVADRLDEIFQVINFLIGIFVIK